MLPIFNKNVVFQYILAVVLAETRDFHLGKTRGSRGKQTKSYGEHRRAVAAAAEAAAASAAART